MCSAWPFCFICVDCCIFRCNLLDGQQLLAKQGSACNMLLGCWSARLSIVCGRGSAERPKCTFFADVRYKQWVHGAASFCACSLLNCTVSKSCTAITVTVMVGVAKHAWRLITQPILARIAQPGQPCHRTAALDKRALQKCMRSTTAASMLLLVSRYNVAPAGT